MNEQEIALSKYLEDFLNGDRYEQYQDIFRSIENNSEIESIIATKWIICHSVLEEVSKKLGTSIWSDSEKLSVLLGKLRIISSYLEGGMDFTSENNLIQFIEGISKSAVDFFDTLKMKKEGNAFILNIEMTYCFPS